MDEWKNIDNKIDGYKLLNFISTKNGTNYDVSNLIKYKNRNLNREEIDKIMDQEKLIIKDLIDKKYSLEKELKNLKSNFLNKISVSNYLNYLSTFKNTKDFRFENIDLKGTGKILDSAKNSSTKIVGNKNSYVLDSVRCIRGWKRIDLTKHAIGTMSDILKLLFDILIKSNDQHLDSIMFLEKIFEPYNKKELKTVFKTKIMDFKGSDIKIENTIYKTKESFVAELNDILKTIERKKSTEKFKILINIILDLFSKVHKILFSMIDVCKKIGIDKKIIERYTESVKTFERMYKNGVKKYFGLDSVNKITKINREDRLFKEVYPIVLKEGKINQKETLKRFSEILLADKNEYIGGPIMERKVAKESLELINKYFKKIVKNKKENYNLIKNITTKLKTKIRTKDIKLMTRKIMDMYEEIRDEDDEVTKRRIMDEVYNEIEGEYRLFKRLESENVQMLNNQNNKNLSEFKKNREKLLVELVYTQILSKMYRNIVIELYKHMRERGSMIKGFQTRLEEMFERIDEEFKIVTNNKINNDLVNENKSKLLNNLLNNNGVVDIDINDGDIVINNSNNNGMNNKLDDIVVNKNKVKKNNRINKKIKKTIFVVYKNEDSYEGFRYGLFNLLNTYKNGKVTKKDIIPSEFIELETLSNVFGKEYLLIGNNVKNINKWRVMNKEYIKQLALMNSTKLRNKIKLILTNPKIFEDVTEEWKGKSGLKLKIKKYCKIFDKCDFLITNNKLSKLI